MEYLHTHIGQFVVQSLLHSLVALFLSEAALKIWRMENHLVKFRYRTATMVVPVLTYPVFQLLHPDRGSFYFSRDVALLVSDGWFQIRLFDGPSAGMVILGLVLVGTGSIFVFQEFLPLLRNSARAPGEESACPADPEIDRLVSELARKPGMDPPPVRILCEDRPVILTSGSRNHTILISSGMIESVPEDQLRSAFAHEMAHIIRRSTLATTFIFIVRVAMFYNPVSLLMFRRLIQDDEHVCDDITVELTGDRDALAETLSLFIAHMPTQVPRVAEMRKTIEEHSHNLLLQERIDRLKGDNNVTPKPFGWLPFLPVQAVIIAVCYFVT